jgi:DNA-directed RNA polymerase subunit RPC12/RpoP
MDIEDQFSLEHLIFSTRVCRICDREKDLLTDFYLTRKHRGYPSSYSYECKSCTVKRILKTRKTNDKNFELEYPDW